MPKTLTKTDQFVEGIRIKKIKKWQLQRKAIQNKP